MSRDLTVYFALPSFRGLFTGNHDEWMPGGAEVQMAALARAFAAAQGVRVVLIFDAPVPRIAEQGITVAGPWKPIERGVPLVSRVINRRRADGAFPALSPKRVFLQSQVEPALLTDAARRNGVKIAYRVNGDSLVDGSDLRAGETLALAQERIRTADLVITQTERQRRLAEANLGISSVVIGSGAAMRPRPTGTPGGGSHVLWVGRCDPIKRPWVFVELAKRFPSTPFAMLMTPGTRLLYDEIRTEAALVPNLTMLDSRPHDEALALYDNALAVVSTSISEGMPNVLIEAAMAAKPFLSYAVDPGGVLADGRIGIAAGNDFEAVCAALAGLLDDRALRARIGEAARAYAEANWDVAATVDAYLDAFDRLFA